MSYVDICGESIPEKENTTHTMLWGKQRAQGACSRVKQAGRTEQTRWNGGQGVKSCDRVGRYKDLAEGFAWRTMMWYKGLKYTVEGQPSGSPMAWTTVVVKEVVRMFGASSCWPQSQDHLLTDWIWGVPINYSSLIFFLLENMERSVNKAQPISLFFCIQYRGLWGIRDFCARLGTLPTRERTDQH